MASETRGHRGWWASVGVGAAICVGCCLAPLLAAIGLAGSGLALLSVSWLEPVGFVLVGIGAAGLVWSRLRATRRGCGSSTDSAGRACGGGACGCATPAATPGPAEIPLLPDPPR